MKRLFFLWLVLLSAHLQAQNIQGSWNGTLDVSGAKLRVVLNIASDGSCTMDSPDQGAKGIPAVLEYVSSDSLLVSVPALKVRYGGKLKEGRVEGVFSQAGFTAPLVLSPGKVTLNRPQTPQPPFPYVTEEVTFRNEKDDATLSGTLTYPVGFDKSASKEVPVVLMVTGSGLQNRDEELFDHKPFAVWADYLAKHGIASLRYDDRGVGKSVGDVRNLTTYNNSLDALAGVKFLKSLGLFDKVGVLGHSEGGTIALMLAARPEREVDFIVSLAGTSIKGIEVLSEQNYILLRMSGLSDQMAKDYCRALAEVCEVRTGGSPYQADEATLDALLKRMEVQLPEAWKKNLLTVFQTSSPWLDYFSQYDPRKDIVNIHCPVMAVNGQLDTQVLPASNLGTLRELLPSNGQTVIKEYKGLNHLFQHCTLGSVAEYNLIEETVSEEVLKDVAEWIARLK